MKIDVGMRGTIRARYFDVKEDGDDGRNDCDVNDNDEQVGMEKMNVNQH